MAKRVKIPGRLESAETGGIVTGTEAVMDDEKGKTQVVINSEVDAAIINLAQGKQDNLTFDSAPTEGSPNPVTSAGVYTADKILSDAIEAILLLIPSAASAMNKLVDMQTMNSSIATATASFKGTYNLVSDLHLGVDATHEQIGAALDALSLGADNNDYAFVQVPNSATAPTEISKTERYKYNGANWLFEYDLNNSGFTQGQWNAINSGVTSLLVGKLSDLPTNAELTALLAGKQDNLTFDNVPTAGSPNPVKSGGVYARNNEIVALINALDIAKQDVLTFDNAPVEGSPNPVKSGGVYTAISAVQAAIVALDAAKQNVLTFDSTPTLGSPNPVTSSGIKTELNRIDGNITTLNDLYEALTQSALVIVQPTDTWPVASPATKTIYRVVDRVNTPPQYYSDYMWNGTTMVLMATYDNAIDAVPTAKSHNLVESGGVYDDLTSNGKHNQYSVTGVRQLEVPLSNLKEGYTVVAKLISDTAATHAIGVLLIDANNNYTIIGGFETIGGEVIYKIEEGEYKSIRFYNNTSAADTVYEITVISNENFDILFNPEKQLIENDIENLQFRADDVFELFAKEDGQRALFISKNIQKGDVVAATLYADTNSSPSITFSLMKNNVATIITAFSYIGEVVYVIAEDDYDQIQFYNNNTPVSNYKCGVSINNPAYKALSEIERNNRWTQYEKSDGRALSVVSDKLKKGNTISIKIDDTDVASYDIDAYLFYGEGNNDYKWIGKLTPENSKIAYECDRDYIRIQCYNFTSTYALYSIAIDNNISKWEYLEWKKQKCLSDERLNVLIIGDSYSENGGRWVQPMCDNLPYVTSWVSLAVGSASVKDKYEDRTEYPYTSRPSAGDNSGNKNTFACQIEKLKRLMAGTDLDTGEVQLYTRPEDYPDIIIIEGGMNDGPDDASVVETYFQQFEQEETNVWRKMYETDPTASQGTVYIKTPIETINRTCFAGAYRYLVDELWHIFPKAQILFTTASGLGYFSGSVVETRFKVAAQQRICANLCAASVIDWSQDGQVCMIHNYPPGSGTEQDPYLYGRVSEPQSVADSNDAMHPNVLGGKKYGKIAARKIIEIFMDIKDL